MTKTWAQIEAAYPTWADVDATGSWNVLEAPLPLVAAASGVSGRPVNYLALHMAASEAAFVAHAAGLNIAGDLDVSIDLAMDDWSQAGMDFNVGFLIGRWRTGQQHWALLIDSTGTPLLIWTTNGSTQITRTSTAAVPFTNGVRNQLRATLDVDNGAAGHTVTFYTRAADADPWTQLGDPITTAGVTSIYTGGTESHLAIGMLQGANTWSQEEWPGKVYKAEVRSGIGGTLIANPRFDLWPGSSHGAGSSTNYTDAQGRVWEVWNGASVVDLTPATAVIVRGAAASGASSAAGSAAATVPTRQAAASGASSSTGSAGPIIPSRIAAASGASSSAGTAGPGVLRIAAATGSSASLGSATARRYKRLYPDAILAATNQAGAVTAIDEDPRAPDGEWLTATDPYAANDVRVSLPSPSLDLEDGPGLQLVKVRIRAAVPA